MFGISTKVRISAGIAAGALALGAAGAYAAQNLPQTIDSSKIFTLGTAGTPQLKLVSLNGAPTLHNDTSPITNPGECVSFFATNRNYALVPQGYTSGPVTISKANYHGKLMSGINAWCKTQMTPKTTTGGASTNSTGSNAGSGSSHGHGHGKPASSTD